MAVSSNSAYSKITSLQELPENARFAVLETYSKILGPDILARTAVFSAIKRLFSELTFRG